MNIAVIGSREFDNYDLLKEELIEFCFDVDYYGDAEGEWCPEYTPRYSDIKIISGGARGADTLAERFASEFCLDTLIFKADWSLYGKSAGYIRNNDIIKSADIVFAFWDGKSKGTKHSIDLANKYNKGLEIIRYD